MSKRDRGASLSTYMDEGFLPEAVDNYLCLLGWSPKENREKLTLAEVIERFDLPQILRHNAKFDFEKLLWLQGEYCRELPNDRFYELAVHALAKAGIDTNKFDVNYVKAALDTCKGKIKTLQRTARLRRLLFPRRNCLRPRSREEKFRAGKQTATGKTPRRLRQSRTVQRRQHRSRAKSDGDELGVKVGVLVHPVRLAVTGNPSGPSLYHLLEVIGKEKSLARIERALASF